MTAMQPWSIQMAQAVARDRPRAAGQRRGLLDDQLDAAVGHAVLVGLLEGELERLDEVTA